MKPTNFPGRKAKRIDDGKLRDAERVTRSPEDQLVKLDDKLGPGLGAVRERARLARAIADRKAPRAAKPVQESQPLVSEGEKRRRDRKGSSPKE